MSTTFYSHRLAKPLLAKRQQAEGFTLVELLIVIVILGVLGAVGVPAYLNQVGLARENAAEQAVMAAAKACTALRVTADADTFEPPSGATGTCTDTGLNTFTSDIDGLTTPAVASVSEGGAVTLTTPAASN